MILYKPLKTQSLLIKHTWALSEIPKNSHEKVALSFLIIVIFQNAGFRCVTEVPTYRLGPDWTYRLTKTK